MEIIMKNFTIILCCIYILEHLLTSGKSVLFRKRPISLILFTLSMALLTYILRVFIPSLANLIPVLLIWIIVGIYNSAPKLTFYYTIFAYGISYGLSSICGAIALVFFVVPFNTSDYNYNYLFLLVYSVLEIAVVIWLFNTKRFRKGIPFLNSFYASKAGIALSVFILVFSILIRIFDAYPTWFVLIAPLSFVVALFLIIHWWQTQITKSYLRELQARELESLRSELEESNRQLDSLKKQNEEMGRLIHKDNKLIPAMESAVFDYLSCADGTNEELTEKGNTLLAELQEFGKNRSEILDSISTIHSQVFRTGLPALDTLLSFMDKCAQSKDITFTMHNSTDLDRWIPAIFSTDDLTHLLSDLIQNALIATTGCEKRNIRLQFYYYKNNPVIELSDTGIPFEAESLLKFGLEERTTHKDTGGSGIGLMDIWKLKTKYHASIHITEHPSDAAFCKKITFLLDKKNMYLVYSNRHEELLQNAARADLLILPLAPKSEGSTFDMHTSS